MCPIMLDAHACCPFFSLSLSLYTFDADDWFRFGHISLFLWAISIIFGRTNMCFALQNRKNNKKRIITNSIDYILEMCAGWQTNAFELQLKQTRRRMCTSAFMISLQFRHWFSLESPCPIRISWFHVRGIRRFLNQMKWVKRTTNCVSVSGRWLNWGRRIFEHNERKVFGKQFSDDSTRR